MEGEGDCQKCEGFGILPRLQANKVPCHIVMDVDIRQKSLGSEKRDFITPHSVGSMSILKFTSAPLAPESHSVE